MFAFKAIHLKFGDPFLNKNFTQKIKKKNSETSLDI